MRLWFIEKKKKKKKKKLACVRVVAGDLTCVTLIVNCVTLTEGDGGLLVKLWEPLTSTDEMCLFLCSLAETTAGGGVWLR